MIFNEKELEYSIIDLIKNKGYIYTHGDDLIREENEVLLINDLKEYLSKRYQLNDISENEINSDYSNRSILKLTNKERFMVLKDYENYLLDQIFNNTDTVNFEEFVETEKFKQTFRRK